jgi:hypothetical protein
MTYSPDSTNPVAVALQENETQTTATLAAIIVKQKPVSMSSDQSIPAVKLYRKVVSLTDLNQSE